MKARFLLALFAAFCALSFSVEAQKCCQDAKRAGRPCEHACCRRVVVGKCENCFPLENQMVALAAHDPLRRIGGELHDLSALFEAPLYSDGWINCPKTWNVIYGHVIQILPNGFLVGTEKLKNWAREEHTIFLKNPPQHKTAIDGSIVIEFAIRAGRYQYTDTGGAVRTIDAYDFGVPASRDELTAAEKKRAEAEESARLKAREEARQAAARRKLDTDLRVLAFQKLQATNGVGYAQYELGLRYLNGDGLPKNLELARHWLTRAATNGFPQAVTQLQTAAQ
jgi:hypothetical protein